MKKVAFLTMDSLDGFYTYDHLLVEPLARRGWAVELVPWRKEGVDWDAFEAVVVRTPWDYQRDPERFLGVLETIERSSARLENPLATVRWNLEKTYLRDLERHGVPIVPTRWGEHLTADSLDGLFTDLDAAEIVVKPVVGANADDTYWLRKDEPAAWASALVAFSEKKYMAQPFVPSVVAEGEFSLFYFGGEYSHAILKTPKPADFRVQEEHGGTIRAVVPSAALRAQARQVVDTLAPTPLYGRADFVRLEGEHFALMELELIEPSLYFSYAPDSPEHFARVFDTWVSGARKSPAPDP